MATFYILPPRELVGEILLGSLRTWLPGFDVDPRRRMAFVDELFEALVSGDTETYVLHREDVPPDADMVEVLRHGYGAAAGDRVVEVASGSRPERPRVRSWCFTDRFPSDFPPGCYNGGID